MKRALAFGFGLALIAAAALAARPAGEFSMFLMLNGHATRWVMADGGWSGMYGSGQQCMPISGKSVLKAIPTAPVNIVVRPTPDGVGWDGGTSIGVGDPNFGEPLQPWVPWYVIPHQNATHLCQTTDAGTAAATPVWQML